MAQLDLRNKVEVYEIDRNEPKEKLKSDKSLLIVENH